MVQSATLRLFSPSAVSGRALHALQLNGAWAEGEISWGNQPATIGTAATATSGTGNREWNVTAQVQSMVATSTNHGFLVRHADEGGNGFEQQFNSRENGSNPPQLLVTYGQAGVATPAPTGAPPTATPTGVLPMATPTATPTPALPVPTPACTVTTVTYQANADGWLQQNSPTSNKGSDSDLKVKSQGPSDNFRAVVRFGLPASLPAGCAIDTATLRMNAGSATSGRTLEALRLNGAWAESGVTWGNQPATIGTAATVTSGTGNREWNVTAQVQDIFAANANYGFLIRDASENHTGSEQTFRSRESSSNKPVLIVRYKAAGAPTPNQAASLPIDPPVVQAEDINCHEALGAITAGNLRVPEGAWCTLDGASIQGTITVERNATFRSTNIQVEGNIQSEGAAAVDVLGSSTVGGSVQIVQGRAVQIDTTTVGGDVLFDQNSSSILATNNTIAGNLQVFQNTGGLLITGNTIDGNLQCKQNAPPPTGAANVVKGNCACPQE